MDRKEFVKAYTDFIQCVKRLNESVRKNGLSSLANYIEDLNDKDLKMALRFVVDEVDISIIDEIFTNYIRFAKDEYECQFKTIQKRAVLGIRKQENMRILYYVLNSYANLSSDEQHEIDIIMLCEGDAPDELKNGKDAPKKPAARPAHEVKIYAVYTFHNVRHWVLAKEEIELEFRKNPQGIDFGDTSNPVITTFLDCPDPARIDKIIHKFDNGLSRADYEEIDLLN